MVEKRAGGGGAGELQLLSTMAVSGKHPSKRSEHQKKKKRIARQRGDVGEKLCQAHPSAGGVAAPVHRGEGGAPMQREALGLAPSCMTSS